MKFNSMKATGQAMFLKIPFQRTDPIYCFCIFLILVLINYMKLHLIFIHSILFSLDFSSLTLGNLSACIVPSSQLGLIIRALSLFSSIQMTHTFQLKNLQLKIFSKYFVSCSILSKSYQGFYFYCDLYLRKLRSRFFEFYKRTCCQVVLHHYFFCQKLLEQLYQQHQIELV